MSSKKGTLWPAPPHTVAKIKLVEEYLVRWVRVLGLAGAKEFLIVDGFAGPGKYEDNVQGSPIAMIKAALRSRSQAPSAKFDFVFIEADEDRFEHLQNHVQKLPVVNGFNIHLLNGEFESVYPELKKQFPSSFTTRSPLFVFLDPFGAKGVPWSVVTDLLRSPTSEVLINFDADGIGRNKDNAELMDEIMGENGWRNDLNGTKFNLFCRNLVGRYKKNLRRLPSVNYAFSFEMRTKGSGLDFFLIFASQNPKGLIEMKQAMKTIDQSGEYRFSDALIGQESFFKFDDPADYWESIWQRFKGSSPKREEVEMYILNETPFWNFHKILRIIYDRKLLKALPDDGTIRKGYFNKANALQFIDKRNGDTLFD
ncbi:MAG TPA: three-Cys-motif partner protein TcmP [Candidatus Kapabacteria bacterium]